MKRAFAVALALAAFPAGLDAGPPTETLRFPGLGMVSLYAPAGPPAQVVLFVSGDGGWNLGVVSMAELIRDRGAVLKCGYAGVPVTNLVFRLSYKGPEYAADFVSEARIGGPVHEKREEYIARSPVYHVDKIKVPVLVHVATNDQDVNFVEDQMMIHALEYHLPRLAETKIYVDPPGGHSFDRLVNAEKTAPQNTIPQRDSWNRIWTFLETNLKPYLGADGKPVADR